MIDLISISAKGKKNRATELVRILATSEAYQDVIDYCFIQTTTIGLRYRFETRKCLSRELHQSGNSQSKTVTRPDGNKTTKIEHDQLVSFPTLEQRRARKVAVEYPKS